MPPVEKKPVQEKPEGAYDYGSWRSIAAGTLQNKKSFLEEGTPFQETIDGLLGLMPIGARNVTYLPAEAVAQLQEDGGEKDISKLKGVQSFSHGPYLDDWSKVPSEIAAQYNTSPTFQGLK